jgi:hypothetical protein
MPRPEETKPKTAPPEPGELEAEEIRPCRSRACIVPQASSRIFGGATRRLRIFWRESHRIAYALAIRFENIKTIETN